MRDNKNIYHTKAYWVKLADSNVKLGHLERTLQKHSTMYAEFQL